MLRERNKWVIITLDNIQNNEARKVSFKIPHHVKYCKGMDFSSNTPGKEANNYMVGNLSLFFQDRKTHPLHYTVERKPFDQYTRKPGELKIDDCLEGGSYIQGYYVDLGYAENFPYRVKIYLHCIEEVEFAETKTQAHG